MSPAKATPTDHLRARRLAQPLEDAVLTLIDKPGRPGWIVMDYRDGHPVAWAPFAWAARLLSRRRFLDYVRPGTGW